MNEPECAMRQQKHLELDEQIDRLERINSRLNSLIFKIEGTGDEDKAACPTTQRSLSSVLTTGPERISRVIDDAVEQINSIESLIF